MRKDFKMFVDEVHGVKLNAGNGGDGCLSFRREKFIPKGGPNGGDGGNGGAVILVGDENINDLSAYRFKPHARAENGEGGMGSDMHGRSGENCTLPIPIGTVVVDSETHNFVAEITSHGQEIVLLRGGIGGKGNVHFKSSTNQAPRRTTDGTPGESGTFDLVLKTIADIGLVGFPNAGKSTLMRLLTNATPKVANYPFTTLHVNIGTMSDGASGNKLILADIPGLISGAHENRGLGVRFLKHIERCSTLLFIVDMSGVDGRSPPHDYTALLNELSCYDNALMMKQKIVIANKMDVAESEENLRIFRRFHSIEPIAISCTSGSGVDALRRFLLRSISGTYGKCRSSHRLVASPVASGD
jgi:GTP-binding protein